MKKKIPETLIVLLFIFACAEIFAAHPVDDFNDSDLNNLQGHQWTLYSDGFSTLAINFEDHGNAQALRLKTDFKKGAAYQYTGISCYFSQQTAGIELKKYHGIRFWAKGSSTFQVKLPFPATNVEYNHYEREIIPGEDWKLYEVPFESMGQKYGKSIPMDLSQVNAVIFGSNGVAGVGSDFYVDDVEFYTLEEAQPVVKANPVDFRPKINQLGFLPDAEKYFSIISPNALPGQKFSIVNADDLKIAAEGKLSDKLFDDVAASGEKVLRGYFSEFKQTGSYRIKIDSFYSHSFTIGADIYKDLFRDALRSFYTNRCGVALEDVLTEIDHKACHTGDTLIRKKTGKYTDFTGGWHNAGDYGKWTHMAAISTANMLWLYELSSSETRNINLETPESENEISDILDQARWGLEWLLKMQRADGAVYHKVDTQPDFASGKKPEDDTLKRYASFQSATEIQEPSAIDAADFTAVMLQAFRVFKSVDAVFAARCKDAALLSWKWLLSNPDKGQSDIYYTDMDASKEMLWALAEMARYNPGTEIISRLNSEFGKNHFASLSWQEPHSFGYYTIAFSDDKSLPTEVAKESILTFADQVVTKINSSGYGVPLTTEQYFWGSNENVAGYGCTLISAYKLSGQMKYRNGALSCTNYLLGNNALNHCYVTGYGTVRTEHPLHWTYMSYGKIILGWLSGGPNQYATGADPLLLNKIKEGTPPAECFVDQAGGSGSWASNEGQTSSNATFLFMVGMISESEITNGIADMKSKNETKKFMEGACISDSVVFLFTSYEGKEQTADVVILDISGKIILSMEIYLKQGKNTYRLNLKEKRQPNGMWIAKVSLKESGYTESVKVINQ